MQSTVDSQALGRRRCVCVRQRNQHSGMPAHSGKKVTALVLESECAIVIAKPVEKVTFLELVLVIHCSWQDRVC